MHSENATASEVSTIEGGDDSTIAPQQTTIDWQRSTVWWLFASEFVTLGWRSSHIFFVAVGLFLYRFGEILIQRLFQIEVESDFFPDRFTSNYNLLTDHLFFRFFRFQANPKWVIDGLSILDAGYALMIVAWFALVWSFFGGVIIRRSVIDLGLRSTTTWPSAIKFVLGRWILIFEAVAIQTLAVLSICIIPLLLGLIGRFGAVGEFLSLIGLLCTLVLIIPVAWLIFLCFFGFPFVTAAMVTEREIDAFDGLSRAAAYLFRRPAILLLLTVVGGAILLVLDFFVGYLFHISFSLLKNVYLSVSGFQDAWVGFDSGLTRKMWVVLKFVASSLIDALSISVFWSGVAAAYLILRREVDQVNYDEMDKATIDRH